MVVKSRFTVFAAVLCFVTQCSSFRVALRDDAKNGLRGEFGNFPCFCLSTCARHRSIPPHAEKKGGTQGREFADCNSVFPHRGWGVVGAKGLPHPTPLCKKLSVSWMRAVQNIRLF